MLILDKSNLKCDHEPYHELILNTKDDKMLNSGSKGRNQFLNSEHLNQIPKF